MNFSNQIVFFVIVALLLLNGTGCSRPGSHARSSSSSRPAAESSSAAGEVAKENDGKVAGVGAEADATKLSESDWAGFLGNEGKARSADTVPVSWSDTENVLWKKALPGTGSSSPIIVGDRLIVTCYVEGASAKRQVLCFDKKNGNQLWSSGYPIEYREDAYSGFLTEHGYASNTPVSDGESLFVFLGKGGVHRLTLEGEKGWSFDVGKGSSNREWGSAASLLLYKNLVIVNAAEEGKTIIAIDKSTGKEVWRQDADLLELTFGTPRVVTLDDGEDQIVITVPHEIWGMNPLTGKLKWHAEIPIEGNVTPSTIVDGQTVYGFGGYQVSGSFALTAGGKGDITKTNLLWSGRPTSYVATPLLHEGAFFWIDNKGIANSSSASTGERFYRERVKGLSGKQPVYASPVMIGGKIYVVTRLAGTIIYAPGKTFEPLAQNKLESDESDFNASPCVSQGKLYLRSNKAIYCVGESQ